MAKHIDDVAQELVNFNAVSDLEEGRKRVKDAAKERNVKLAGDEMSDEDYQTLVSDLRNP